MKKILIANIFGIGDVLFTTPLISSLKKGIAGVKVDYLCNQRAKDIVDLVPEVDDIFVYEKDHYVDLWKKSKIGCLKELNGLFRNIRQKKYDAVFDFTLSREFGLFFTLAGIPRRLGPDYKKRGLFLTDKMPLAGFEGKHVAEHYLDLMNFLGLTAEDREMRIVPEREEREKMMALLRSKGVEEGPVVAIAPGGGASWGAHASRKRWDPIGFTCTADILAGQDVKVVLTGDASEKELCEEVARGMDNAPIAIVNGLSLKEYAAFLSSCDLVLCNDGGPLHIAVAAGAMTVSIFGPVDDAVYGPFPVSERHRVIRADEVPCRPCYNKFKLPECKFEGRCLLDISPEKVAEVCLEQLGK